MAPTGLDGPDQLHVGPPLPMGPGAPFQLRVGLTVPAWAVLNLPPLSLALPPGCTWTYAVGNLTLEWPLWSYAPACFQSCHVVTLSLVLPPAPSALALDRSPEWLLGLVLHFHIRGY